ncbi:hypothetical protein [Aquimarina sp. MMG016]|uniref:hypothetical protein n=1 Tax=Aquimarina sp. MMG016 TaxID=2822690 RepID=UPI001B3A5587|nr:hypothetical protein [Aquimarina sp. MMG016]MBQ4820166.1 hypothetical protein [Aquimarina sp. MMG016]
MNKLFYLIIIAVIISCKSNTVAQEKSLKEKKANIENIDEVKPKTDINKSDNSMNDKMIISGGLPQNDLIEPGAIHLRGSVIAFYKNTTICNRPYKAALKISIERILKSGPGIVNVLSQNQEITLGFVNGVYTKELNALQNKMMKGKILSVMVKEGLCPNLGNDTVYEIVRFEEK